MSESHTKTATTSSIKKAHKPIDVNRRLVKEYRAAMHEFKLAMQLRDEFSLRIGKRTTQIIRFSMLGMLLLMIALFYLIYILTNNLNQITTHMASISTRMDGMHQHFGQVVSNMHTMQYNMAGIGSTMQAMQQDIHGVARIDDHMLAIQNDTQHISLAIQSMQIDVNNMDSHISNMSGHFGSLNQKMGHMGRDVNRLSAPMRWFPFLP